MKEIKVAISANRAEMEMDIDGLKINLTAEEVDQLRQVLMQNREALWPPLIREDVPRAEQVPVETDWQWFVQQPPDNIKGVILHIWHRGVGWTSYLLQRPQITALRENLANWTRH